MQFVFQPQKLLHLALQQLRNRNSGPAAYYLGDIFFINFFFHQAGHALVSRNPLLLGFQVALDFLPFQYISYVPLLIYLGKLSGGAAWRALGIQIFWVLALVALGHAMWQWSSRKITVQGG